MKYRATGEMEREYSFDFEFDTDKYFDGTPDLNDINDLVEELVSDFDVEVNLEKSIIDVNKIVEVEEVEEVEEYGDVTEENKEVLKFLEK